MADSSRRIVWAFWHRGEFEAVTYVDMLILPLTMDDHRVKMGDFYVEKGLKEIQAGNVRDGLRLLRLGVARSLATLKDEKLLLESLKLRLSAMIKPPNC